jgi:hypothetical protein
VERIPNSAEEDKHLPTANHNNVAFTDSTGATGVLNRSQSNFVERYAFGELETYTAYLQDLNFGPGHRDESAFKAFLRAGSLGIRAQDAIAQVVAETTATGGTIDPTKLKSQLRRTYEFVGVQAGALKAIVMPPKAVFDPERLKRCASKVMGIDMGWLRAHSPIPVNAVTSADFLESLYERGEGIVVFTTFKSQGQTIHIVGSAENATLPTKGTEGVWFLVNPVDGQFHPNPRQENKLSRRSEESVTSWRYLVLESDEAEPNEWLSCVVQFPLRIVAIYTSGGKSIHALVRLDAKSKQDWDRKKDLIAPIVVTLGADPQALTAVRLSRLPGTLRGERPQELLYLDPLADGISIIGKAD